MKKVFKNKQLCLDTDPDQCLQMLSILTSRERRSKRGIKYCKPGWKGQGREGSEEDHA